MSNTIIYIAEIFNEKPVKLLFDNFRIVYYLITGIY